MEALEGKAKPKIKVTNVPAPEGHNSDKDGDPKEKILADSFRDIGAIDDQIDKLRTQRNEIFNALKNQTDVGKTVLREQYAARRKLEKDVYDQKEAQRQWCYEALNAQGFLFKMPSEDEGLKLGKKSIIEASVSKH
jgi:hypothetical protein